MHLRFAERMTEQWQALTGYCPSPAQLSGWLQLARTAYDRENWQAPLQVVQLPTGSGKTEALKVLCAMQGPEHHPGILIVTKFRDEADKLAADINQLSRQSVARAFHGDAPALGTDLQHVRVLVITHEGYRRGLIEVANSGTDTALERYRTFLRLEGVTLRASQRWLFIDEAFDWVDAHSLKLSELRSMSADLRGRLQGDAARELDSLLAVLIELTDCADTGRPDQNLTPAQFNVLAGIDIDSLADSVRLLCRHELEQWVPDDAEKPDRSSGTKPLETTDFRAEYLKLLAGLKHIVRCGFAWRSRRQGLALLHSSRSLLGTGASWGIILDATAGIDPVYQLMGDRVNVLPRPEGIRVYGNVTLHASTGHKVGKEYLARNAMQEWPSVIGELADRLEGRATLVCGHKATLNVIDQYGPNTGIRYTNWGKIDGKNDWRDSNVVICFGLPYLDDIAPAQTFFAYQGQQSDDWFQGARRFNQHADIRATLKNGFVARSVVQAVNRSRCRVVTGPDGGCLPTEIYLLLPRGQTSDVVRQALHSQMPGIRERAWRVRASKRKVRRKPTDQRLISYFTSAQAGTHMRRDLAQLLSISSNSMDRMVSRLLDQASELAQALSDLGVRYVSTPGRGKEAYFIKE